MINEKDNTNSEIWDHIAKAYDDVSSVSAAHLIKFDILSDLIIKNNASNILDLGCGGGILEYFLEKKGYKGKVLGLDFSESMLKIAKQKLGSNSRYIYKKHDLNKKIDIISNSYDLVVMVNVLFFLNKPEKIIDEIKRILKPRGILLIVNPKPKGNIFYFFSEQIKLKDNSMIKMFRKKTLTLGNLLSTIKVISTQKKIEKFNKQDKIRIQDLNELKDLVCGGGFKLIEIKEIQARQNWLLVVRSD